VKITYLKLLKSLRSAGSVAFKDSGCR